MMRDDVIGDDLKMDEPTVLNEIQLQRCMRIWTTDVGRCPRNQQHRILDLVPPLPKHVLSVKGSMVHKGIENTVKKQDTEPVDWGDYPAEYRPFIEEEMLPTMKNAHKWIESTTIDLTHAEAEVKYEMPLPLGYTISRGIDLLTPEWIIDFKSGSKEQTEHRLDVLISERMVEAAGEGPRKMMIVYLGGEEPREYEMYGKGKRSTPEDDMLKIEAQLQECIANREMIRTGHKVPAKPDFLCGMCEYRHVCNGI